MAKKNKDKRTARGRLDWTSVIVVTIRALRAIATVAIITHGG